ncbi:unnamed protein product [Orchesella dallaii]|uniref:Uncharacterized protein n=1 Tax=Orchesella dallaii TaxID=48710 RepID=A0ABP1PIW3_9HEXA
MQRLLGYVSALNASLTSKNPKRSTFIFVQNAQLNKDKPLIQKIMLSSTESKKIALALLKRNETALKNERLRRHKATNHNFRNFSAGTSNLIHPALHLALFF